MWPFTRFNKKKDPIVSVVPTGRVIKQFSPTETFECEDMHSVYVKGMTYSVRFGNKKLTDKVKKWEESNLVRVG